MQKRNPNDEIRVAYAYFATHNANIISFNNMKSFLNVGVCVCLCVHCDWESYVYCISCMPKCVCVCVCVLFNINRIRYVSLSISAMWCTQTHTQEHAYNSFDMDYGTMSMLMMPFV